MVTNEYPLLIYLAGNFKNLKDKKLFTVQSFVGLRSVLPYIEPIEFQF